MKKYLTLLFLSLLAGPASAITLTMAPAPGGTTLIDFSTPSPVPGSGVVSWQDANVYAATDLPNAAQPLPDGEGNYLASNVPGQDSGSTSILFGGTVTYLGFLWGSPDTYNTIQFFSGTDSVGVFTGASLPPSDGNQGLSPFVSFTGGSFDRVVLSSTQYNFEIDSVRFLRPVADPTGTDNVPEGGAGLAVLGSLIGLGALIKHRRK